MTGIGAGYKMESQEARTLASITVDSYDYRDQGKLLSKLTSDVSYLAQYSRQMQKGIDAANSNFIEQLQDFINEVAVVIGGFGNTGIDLGDLKYVFQAIGALFGFDTATGIAGALPLNLMSAAWHFVKTYVLGTDAETPGEYFDWLIDQILRTALDWLGEVPILGGAVEVISMWVTQFRDAIKSTVQLLLSWSTPILEAIKAGVDLFNQIFGAWTEPIATWISDSVGWLMGIFGGWTQVIADWVTSSLNWLVELFGGWTGPFVTWITNSLTGLMEIFGEWSLAIANWVRSSLTWLAETFAAWTAPIAQWVTEVVQFVSDVFGEWSAQVAAWIKATVEWLGAIFADWTAPIVQWVTQTAQFVSDAFGSWSAAIATWIFESVDWLTTIFDSWTGPFADLVKGAIAAIQQIVDWFTGTVGAAFEMLFPWAKKLPQMQIVNGQEVLKTANVPAIDASKVQGGTLSTDVIANGSLGGHKLSDYAISSDKLGTNAVTAPKLSDYAVGTSKLADYAISSTKIGQDAVTTYAIAPDAVTSNEIATNAVTNNELAGNAVQTANINNGAVTGAKTTDLDGSKVTGGTIPVQVIPVTQIGKELTTTGSGAMLVRTTASVQGVSQGLNYIPAGFFNTYSYKTGDINFISSNQGMQVTYAGWYMVELSYKLNAIATWGWNFTPVLRVSGGGDKYGTDCMYTWTAIGSAGAQRCVQNSFIVYLGNGGAVYAGYDCTMGAGFGDTNVLGGGSSAQTYFSISLLNRSYA